ncbi:hypothetical protein [Marinifilum flexuosum]|uniref:hypothetical protein n=1 Tax=Marinifilum flexuosum TaxID=1117708 RepID=UPI0024915EB5|nr:hypothetical protein [Marinifilum flexuosum]
MRKVLFFAAALLLVWSCSKDETSELIPENEFFKVQPDNLDVKIFYDYMKNVDTEDIKSKTDADIWGVPIWNKEVSYISNNKKMYLIPYVEKKHEEINAILVISVDYIEFKYGMYLNDTDNYPSEKFEWIFEYFKQEVFKNNPKYKFELSKDSNNTNTKGWHIEYCNDVYTGNDNIGWNYVGRNCFNTYIPSVPSAITDRDGGDGEYGGDFSNPGGGSPSPSPAPPVNTSTEFKKSKAGCVQERLMLETSFINNLIKGFVPVNRSTLKLRFEIGYIPYSNGLRVNGRTYSNKSPRNPYDNTILIKINEQILNESPLKIATVLAHEMIHAEIFRWIEKSKWKPSNIEESYPELWQEFLLSGKKLEIAQHELMTKKYVEDLANLLKWFDKGRHSDAEYHAMSWMGLHKTSAFKNQDAKKIKDLQKKISNEKGDCDDI